MLAHSKPTVAPLRGVPSLLPSLCPSSCQVEDVADVDVLLLTQGLDDHCHVRTVQRLAALRPDLQVVASPSCKPVLEALAFTQVGGGGREKGR